MMCNADPRTEEPSNDELWKWMGDEVEVSRGKEGGKGSYPGKVERLRTRGTRRRVENQETSTSSSSSRYI